MTLPKLTKEVADQQYDTAMEYLDSILDEPEDFGSPTFAKEAIVLDNGDGTWSVHYGYVIYSLDEQGLRQDALDFENWLNQQKF